MSPDSSSIQRTTYRPSRTACEEDRSGFVLAEQAYSSLRDPRPPGLVSHPRGETKASGADVFLFRSDAEDFQPLI